jgi:hypothetical protein
MRRHSFVRALTTTTLLLCWANPFAWAAQPKADLTVELRQIKESQEDQDSPQASGGGGAYTASTTNRAVDFAPQQVRVRNGDKASLHINQSMPMQWVQKIESQSATLSAAGTSASNNSGGVTQAVTWMESGQSLVVRPNWAGGKQAVKLDIEVQSSAVDERTSSDLPATAHQRYSTTVSAPLRQWVTIATSGSAAKPGSYSSAGGSDGRRLTQVRVTAN